MAVVSSAKAGVRAAARATVIQLRAPGLTARELEREARTLVRESTVPVIVSSRCDIALAAGAAGVNLPERDISPRDARRLLGDGLVGRSVHSLEAASQAERDGADFVVFGPVWATPSHPDERPRGLETLREVAASTSLPVLAIGGVTERRIAAVLSVCAGYAAVRLFE